MEGLEKLSGILTGMAEELDDLAESYATSDDRGTERREDPGGNRPGR